MRHDDRIALPTFAMVRSGNPLQIGMGIVLNLSVPFFNLVKYIIISLGLGILSETVGDALERVRRSFSLLRNGKVVIGGRKNRLFRTVSFGASPTVLICSIILTIAILVAEGSLEFGSNTVSIGVPIMGTRRSKALGDIRLYTTKELRRSVVEPVLGKCDTCATRMGDKIAVWSSRLYTVETGDSMTERVGCARNLTTSHLMENLKNAKCIELGFLRNETERLARDYGGVVQPSFDSGYVFAELSLNISVGFFRIWRSNRVEGELIVLGTVRPGMDVQSGEQSSVLECLITRRTSNVSTTNVLHGCLRHTRNRKRFVYFQRRRAGDVVVRSEELWRGHLFSATMTDTMDTERRAQVLSAGTRQRAVPPIQAILMMSLLGRMAEEGELSEKPEKTEETVVGYTEILRPEVEIWAVLVFAIAMGGLSILSAVGNAASSRVFPLGQLVGEQNLLRKWAMEKEALRFDDNKGAKIWLVREGTEDKMSITVQCDETADIPTAKRLFSKEVKIFD